MAYATQADLQTRFGTDNVAVWSDVSNSGTADAARITVALALASQRIDDLLRGGPYVVPLVELTSEASRRVVEWCTVMAGYWLISGRGLGENVAIDDIKTLHDDVVSDIRASMMGENRLYMQAVDSMPTAPICV